jgi:hypothetical protein
LSQRKGGFNVIKGLNEAFKKLFLNKSGSEHDWPALGLMAILVLADLMGRYYFFRPITGSYEIIPLMIIIPVALGLAYTALRRERPS